MSKKKDKIKQVVERVKDKLGHLHTKNVEDPKKLKPSKKKKEEKDKKSPKDKKPAAAVTSCPRGGQYRLSPTGKKQYIKKSLDEWLKEVEAIDAFIEKFKHFKGLQ